MCSIFLRVKIVIKINKKKIFFKPYEFQQQQSQQSQQQPQLLPFSYFSPIPAGLYPAILQQQAGTPNSTTNDPFQQQLQNVRKFYFILNQKKNEFFWRLFWQIIFS